MPVTIRKLPDNPIIFAQATGYLSYDHAIETFNDIDDILSEHSGDHFYMVADVRGDFEFSYDTISRVLEASGQIPGGMKDPRLVPIIVSSGAFKDMLETQIGNRFPDVQMPFFETCTEAFSFVAFLLES